MKKFAFIGAGSFGFTRVLIKDLLSFEKFSDATIALMDIDDERLDFITRAVERIVQKGNYKAKIISTKNRQEALEGADGVICTILNGGLNVWRKDIEIPKKHGVDINVGDTRGPSGIFRALRTIPVMLDICKDIEKYCPKAVFLNYTNPMSMLCRAMQGATDVNVTGLCHSVQGTSELLAKWINAPIEEIAYTCVGINHQAFFIDYKWNGKDAYPLIRDAILTKKEVYEEEIVRNEMFLALDYYVTESSGHNSEYNAWFRKRPDLIEKYCNHGTGWNPGLSGFIVGEYEKREDTWKKEITDWFNDPNLDISRGHEYAAYIFNAIFGDNTVVQFNGNVRNTGLIDNLPDGCCVEVPIYASKRGLEAVKVGKLPSQLAALIGQNVMVEEMAIEGCMTGDKKKIYQAICMDPLTAATLSLQEIKDMTNEMFEANKQWLVQFDHTKSII